MNLKLSDKEIDILPILQWLECPDSLPNRLRTLQ